MKILTINMHLIIFFSGLMYMKGIDQDMNPNRILGRDQSVPSVSPEVREEVTTLSADFHNNIAGIVYIFLYSCS